MSELNIKFVTLVVVISLLCFFIPDRGGGAYDVNTSIIAHFDNGDVAMYNVTHPNYAGLGIHQSRGGNRLSTWRYCMFKGLIKCEKTLIYGIQRFTYN